MLAAAWLLTAPDAAAEWVVTPFVAANIGGAATVSAGAARDNTRNTFARSFVYGVSVARRIARAFSIEADVAHSPHAFANSEPPNSFQFTADSSSITTAIAVAPP